MAFVHCGTALRIRAVGDVGGRRCCRRRCAGAVQMSQSGGDQMKQVMAELERLREENERLKGSQAPSNNAATRLGGGSDAAAPSRPAKTAQLQLLPPSEAAVPVVQAEIDDLSFFPRVVPLAGALSELTAESLMEPPDLGRPYAIASVSAPLPADREWTGDLLSVRGCPQVAAAKSLVAAYASSDAVGIAFPDGRTHDVVLVLERDASELEKFDKKAFYVWQHVEEGGALRFGWLEEEPPASEAVRVAKVIAAVFQQVRTRQLQPGFAELDDDFEF